MLAALVVKMLWFPGFMVNSLVSLRPQSSQFDRFPSWPWERAASPLRRCSRTLDSPRHRERKPRSAAGAHIQPLRPGFDFPRQTLRYEAEYRFWTAGVATLRVERTGNQEHITGTADSTGVVALLFRVQDRFNSYFDAQSLCSPKLVKHTEEGSHWRDTSITFDYSRGKSILEEKNLKDRAVETYRKRHPWMRDRRGLGNSLRLQPAACSRTRPTASRSMTAARPSPSRRMWKAKSRSRPRQGRFRPFVLGRKATTAH